MVTEHNSILVLGHPIYEEFKNLIGEDATRKIANRYGSERLYLPQPKKTTPCSCTSCPFARDFAAFQKRLRSFKPIKIKASKPFKPSKPYVYL